MSRLLAIKRLKYVSTAISILTLFISGNILTSIIIGLSFYGIMSDLFNNDKLTIKGVLIILSILLSLTTNNLIKAISIVLIIIIIIKEEQLKELFKRIGFK